MFAVRQVKTYNFMGHAQRTLDIPEKGIVLITGCNGAGKSTFIEAIAVAFWGSTRRGTTPWRTNVPGSVEVITDAFHVRRGVDKAHKQSLLWNEAGKPLARVGKDAKGDTASKAQAALAKVVPSIDVWAWACVLSNVDTSTFTASSNAARMTLLESMMSLVSTESPLKLLRSELAAWRTQLASLEGRRNVLTAKLEAETRRMSEADAWVESDAPDIEVITSLGKAAKAELEAAVEAVSRVQAKVDAAIRDLEQNAVHDQGLGDRLGDLQAEAATAAANTRTLTAKHRACGQGDCPTCGQRIDPEVALQAAAELQAAVELQAATTKALDVERARVSAQRAQAATERARLAQAQQALRQQVAPAMAEQTRCQANYEKLKRDYQAAVAEQARRGKVTEVKAQSAQAIEALRLELSDAETKIAELQHCIARDEVVEQLLGVKGVRTKVIGETLDTITQVANGWLARVAGPKFRVKLKPYSEKGVRSAISLDVMGAGGGHGYWASSGGERKRIDLALMLALGDISRQAHGAQTATLFFDEAFDSLDVPGREACVRLLRELAQTRAVVVVSHEEKLIKALEQVAQRVHLE